MAKVQASRAGGNRQLLRRMSAKSDNVIDRVVKFANDDVPDYLENLQRFQRKSSRIHIVIK